MSGKTKWTGIIMILLFCAGCDKVLEPSYTVTFDANGATSGTAPGSQTGQGGSSIQLPSGNGLSRTGYSFGGWNKYPDGTTGTTYKAGSDFQIERDITLYAVWNLPSGPYSVIFNANGATNGSAPEAQTADAGSVITLPGRGTLSRTGYTFGGWNTNAFGNGTSFDADSSYIVSSNIIFYATWNRSYYSISEIDNQFARAERDLIWWGFEDAELLFVHKIGTISGSLVGLLAPPVPYNGTGTTSISYSKSYTETSARDWSVSNVALQTSENRAKVSAEIPLPTVPAAFELGYGNTWTDTTKTTRIGKSLSEMLGGQSTVQYAISPEMGAGNYAIAAFARYSVFQTTRYSLTTNSIISSELSFALSAGEPGMAIYLVKDSDIIGSLNEMLEGTTPGLSAIKNITQGEIEEGKKFAKGKIKSTYTATVGNVEKFTSGGNDWSAYRKLDTLNANPISNGSVFRTAGIKLDLLKAYYTEVQLNLSYQLKTNDNYERIQIKIVNQKTTDQFGETVEHKPNGQYSFRFGLSKISSTDLVEIELRVKTTWGIAIYHELEIYANRQYSFSFY
jgi:uncharacterized repeat protein (TIGR02543 family)